jgi:hypothetical protein
MGVFSHPDRIRRLRSALLSVLGLATPAIVLSVVGCGAKPWQPPPPWGQTYAYDYQGFKSSDTVVVAGGGAGGPAYAGVFAFRDRKGVHEEAGGKNPFTQSAPIDGYSFNTHLEGQGARLLPSGAVVPAPAVSISVSASASVSVPK